MLSSVFALIAGLIHIYIFLMESILWGKPRINKVFGMTSEQAENNRLFAFNQGFYNLFLALGAIFGSIMVINNSSPTAVTLMVFSCACMFGAACVLFFSAKKLLRPALIQGIPPLIALATIFLT